MGVLVGQQAPSFTAAAVQNGAIIEKFTLNQFKGKTVLLFFYPLDFTFVCPTELHAFQECLGQFSKRNTQIIGCSVDSVYCHLAWLNTPKARPSMFRGVAPARGSRPPSQAAPRSACLLAG